MYIINLPKYSSRANISILSLSVLYVFRDNLLSSPLFQLEHEITVPSHNFPISPRILARPKICLPNQHYVFKVKLNQILTLIGNFPLVNQDRKQVIAMKLGPKVFSYIFHVTYQTPQLLTYILFILILSPAINLFKEYELNQNTRRQKKLTATIKKSDLSEISMLQLV